MTHSTIRSLVLVAALCAVLSAPACQSPQRAPEPAGQAVVVYARERIFDANVVGDRLAALGFDVELQIEGPLSRERSSAAVYGLRTSETRLDKVRDAVSSLPEIEVLPFAQPGPGDTDVVVWLIGAQGPESDLDEDAPEEAANEAPMPGEEPSPDGGPPLDDRP